MRHSTYNYQGHDSSTQWQQYTQDEFASGTHSICSHTEYSYILYLSDNHKVDCLKILTNDGCPTNNAEDADEPKPPQACLVQHSSKYKQVNEISQKGVATTDIK